MRVLVIGVESSGTGVLTRLLDSLEGVEALHWSTPYAGRLPDLQHDVAWDWAVLIVRDALETAASRIRHRHADTGAAPMPISGYLAWTIGQLQVCGKPWTWTTYENLVARPQTVFNRLADWLGVPRRPLPEPIIDGNARYDDLHRQPA